MTDADRIKELEDDVAKLKGEVIRLWTTIAEERRETEAKITAAAELVLRHAQQSSDGKATNRAR